MTGAATDEGKLLKERGIGRAVDHANRESRAWSDRAVSFIHAYALEHAELTTEMVRLDAESKGMPKPPDGRAWSWPMVKAAKCGWILRTDRWVKSTVPKVHQTRNTIWTSLIYVR